MTFFGMRLSGITVFLFAVIGISLAQIGLGNAIGSFARYLPVVLLAMGGPFLAVAEAQRRMSSNEKRPRRAAALAGTMAEVFAVLAGVSVVEFFMLALGAPNGVPVGLIGPVVLIGFFVDPVNLVCLCIFVGGAIALGAFNTISAVEPVAAPRTARGWEYFLMLACIAMIAGGTFINTAIAGTVSDFATSTRMQALCVFGVIDQGPSNEQFTEEARNACLDASDPQREQHQADCTTRNESYNLSCKKAKIPAAAQGTGADCDTVFPGFKDVDRVGDSQEGRAYITCVARQRTAQAVVAHDATRCLFPEADPTVRKFDWVWWQLQVQQCTAHFVGTAPWRQSCLSINANRKIIPSDAEYTKELVDACCILPDASNDAVWNNGQGPTDLGAVQNACHPSS